MDLYEVQEVHEGGMGLVYRVHHREWDMDLAMKSPRSSLFRNDRDKENFEREAETWVRLGLHPHTASCFYVRRIAGVPHIFAEYVDGGTLSDWIRDRRLYEGGEKLVLERLLDVAIQFAWGLHFAHEQGLVHRDVKPSNVLMTRNGMVKVTDFGLARLRPRDTISTAGAASSTSTSGQGAGWMTPAYASPEQEAGRRLTRRTDIWSWAASVLEMFYGGLFWVRGPIVNESLDDYLEHGPSPDVDMIPRMPAGISDLLHRCFRRREDERPRDMMEIATNLQQVFLSVTNTRYQREMPDAATLLPDGLNNQAVSLWDLGKHREAEQAWKRALEIQPGHPESTYNHGLVEWRAARINDDRLLAALVPLLKSHPDQQLAKRLVGNVHIERGDSAAAAALLRNDRHDLKLTDGIPEPQGSRRAVRRRVRCIRTGLDLAKSCLARNGCIVLLAGHDWQRRAVLERWDTRLHECKGVVKPWIKEISCLNASHDGNTALIGGKDGRVEVWRFGLVNGGTQEFSHVTGRTSLDKWNEVAKAHRLVGLRIEKPEFEMVPARLPAVAGLKILEVLNVEVPLGELIEIPGLKKLISLRADGVTVASQTLRDLAELRCLRFLGITHSGFTDHDLEYLRNLDAVIELDLTGTRVTDAGLASIAHLSCLRRLILDETAITGSGLDELRRLSSLEELSLVGCPLQYDEVLRLDDLASLKILIQNAIPNEHFYQNPDGKNASSRLNGAQYAGFRGHAQRLDLGVWTGSRQWESSQLKEEITASAFSPSGRLCAVSDAKGNVAVWKWEDGICVGTLNAGSGEVMAIGFCGNETCLVAAMRDDSSTSFRGGFRIWDVESGRLLRHLPEDGTEFYRGASAFSPDGDVAITWLETFSENHSERSATDTWDLQSGERRGVRLCGHGVSPEHLSLSQRGTYAMTMATEIGYPPEAKLWDTSTGRCLFSLECEEDSGRSVSLSGDAATASVGGWRNVDVWEMNAEMPAQMAPFAICRARAVETLTGDRVRFEMALKESERASLAGDMKLAVASLQEARGVDGFDRNNDAIGHWGKLYRRLPRSGLRACWKLTMGTLEKPEGSRWTTMMSVERMAISANGERMVSASSQGCVHLWNVNTGECIGITEPFAETSGGISSLAVDYTGRRCLVVGHPFKGPSELRLCESLSGECIRRFHGNLGRIESVAWSRNGLFAATGGPPVRYKPELLLWDVGTGGIIRKLSGHEDEVERVAFSPDDRRVLSATGSGEASLKLWDVATGECLSTFKGHQGRITSAGFTGDGKLVFSSCKGDHSVRMWNPDTGDCVQVLRHPTEVWTACMAGDNRHLISGGGDHAVRIWDVHTGECLLVIKEHQDMIHDVCVTPDGRYLFTAGNDHTIRRWFLDWELGLREPGDWHPDALAVVLSLVSSIMIIPSGTEWGLGQGARIVDAAMEKGSTYQQLLNSLECSGFGWLKADGVRAKLEEVLASWPGPTVVASAVDPGSPSEGAEQADMDSAREEEQGDSATQADWEPAGKASESGGDSGCDEGRVRDIMDAVLKEWILCDCPKDEEAIEVLISSAIENEFGFLRKDLIAEVNLLFKAHLKNRGTEVGAEESRKDGGTPSIVADGCESESLSMQSTVSWLDVVLLSRSSDLAQIDVERWQAALPEYSRELQQAFREAGESGGEQTFRRNFCIADLECVVAIVQAAKATAVAEEDFTTAAAARDLERHLRELKKTLDQ